MRAMKKATKRMIALCLAAIMTMAMAVSAFATETDGQVRAGQTGTLTVNVDSQNNTLKNQTVSVYKLFDLSVGGNDLDKKYAYTVNAKYKDILKELLNIQDENPTDAKFYEEVKKIGIDNSVELQGFADQFTEKLLKAKPAVVAEDTKKVTGEETSVAFDSLAYGYYLVYQTGTKELQSSLVSVDEATVEIILKGEAPKIEKTADKETVEIGQVVTYTITGTIPDTTGYDQYVYKITDTLTGGLDFVKNAQGEAQVGTDYVVSVQIKDGASSTQTAKLSGDNNRTMTLDLSVWIREAETQKSKGKEFTVTYYAKVNEDAVVTEKNEAKLEYGNNPTDTTTTTPSEAKTPTYPLQIHKSIKDQQGSYLAGVTFRLYRSEDDAKTGANPIAVTGSNGSYTVDLTSGTYDMVSFGDGTTVGQGMNLKLNGLAEGTYWLVETETPDGYNGLTAPVKITITKSGDTTVDNWTISKGDEAAEADKIIDIENSTGTILPETGGMGTVLFTVVAVIMILGVAISFIRSRRTEE